MAAPKALSRRASRAEAPASDGEKIDGALLEFRLAFGRWRRGWPVEWEDACRRMALALGWRGEAEGE